MFLSQAISPVKLNLNLHIIGFNDAGYHLLEGVSVFANYGDVIHLETGDCNGDDLIIHGRYAHALKSERKDDNLIIKAIKFLRNFKNFPFVTVTLEKNIPIQAGYGGGSSNAATILKMLNDIFKLGVSFDKLMGIGRTLGADVPMCLYGKPCFVYNIGDEIIPLDTENKTYFCLLLKPDIMLSTQKVFKALMNKNNPAMDRSDNLIQYAINNGRNDLWQAACDIYPVMYDYLHALQATNPIKAAMSGSGSGLFALYDNQITLHDTYNIIKKKFPNDFLEKTLIDV
jgi:4-diphosphocytidyl-2-C-methyl-D-erythritol kinase